MSMRYLYEFNYGSNFVYRIVQGDSVQTDTYTWTGVQTIQREGDYLSVVDTTGLFPSYVSSNSLAKVIVYCSKYNEDSGQIEEGSKQLYTVANTSDTVCTMRVCDIPEEQLEDAQKLLADGLVQLYEIRLNNSDHSYLHLKNDNSVTWNGYDWTGIPILFEGYSSSQGDSYARPTLTVANPDGAFSTFVRDGYLIRAVVNRYIVMYNDLTHNRPIYQKKTWIIWAVKSLNKNFIQVELRNPMDGVNFEVPARMYIPPEFPFVEN